MLLLLELLTSVVSSIVETLGFGTKSEEDTFLELFHVDFLPTRFPKTVNTILSCGNPADKVVSVSGFRNDFNFSWSFVDNLEWIVWRNWRELRRTSRLDGFRLLVVIMIYRRLIVVIVVV